MTRNDYLLIVFAIAESLADCNGEIPRQAVIVTAQKISRKLKEANPRFNEAKFLKACGVY